MLILDRYILKELLGPFIFGIAAFTCILAGSTVLFFYIGEAIKYHIPALTITQIIFYKIPSVIVYAFPMAMLLSAILAFSRLSSDMEIMAMRAAGISFNRLLISVICMGLTVSLLTIWFNEAVVPRAAQSSETLMQTYREGNLPKLKQSINFTEFSPVDHQPIRTINVAEVEGETLKNITVAEFEQGQLVRIIRSATGRWSNNGQWLFFNGIMHYFPSQNRKNVTIIEFAKEQIDIKINPVDLTKRKKTIEEMTIADLRSRARLKAATGEDPIEDIVNLHMRFSVPFACLIFAILGASVGLRPHRSSSAMGLGISLVVILIYYVLLAFGMSLGLAHTLPPLLATWLPNLLIGAFAFYLLQKIAAQ